MKPRPLWQPPADHVPVNRRLDPRRRRDLSCIPLTHRTFRHRWLSIAIFAGVLVCVWPPDVAWGQVMSTAEVLSRQEEWEQWRLDGNRLTITGRYEGRTGPSFSLNRIPFHFEPPLNSPLPERMQSGQRIEVSGRLSGRTGRLSFDVNRLSVNGTDLDILRERQQLLDASDFAGRFALASEFETVADFYEDQALRREVAALREQAVQTERRHWKGNVDELWQLAAKAEMLKLSPRLAQAIQFEAIVTAWKKPTPNLPAVLKQIEERLPGWNQPTTGQPPVDEAAFLAKPAEIYDNSDDTQRQLLHRQLYRTVLLSTLEARLEGDGSNGLEIAELIQESLPEETAAILRLKQKDLEYRRGRVKSLSRAQLEQLTELQEATGQSTDIPSTVDEWLQAQEIRYRPSGLAGLLRTADEYLFVGTRWQRPEHMENGIRLLKQAWDLASQQSARDAESIAERLRSLGWERLKDQWMTMSQIESLPKDDIQLAMREGRVVPGMTTEQVVGTLGQPARISRIISSRVMRELWIYENQGSSSVIVQFQRSRRTASQDARVSSISTRSGR